MNPDELRDRRKALNLSQPDLGRLLGCSTNTVNRWEREGHAVLHPEMLDLSLRYLESLSPKRLSELVQSKREVKPND